MQVETQGSYLCGGAGSILAQWDDQQFTVDVLISPKAYDLDLSSARSVPDGITWNDLPDAVRAAIRGEAARMISDT